MVHYTDYRYTSGSMNFSSLRLAYPRWIYKRLDLVMRGNDLVITHEFWLDDQVFRPELVISDVPTGTQEWLSAPEAREYAFTLGLIELISYWKATCSPEIVIEAGYLNAAQIKWWQELWRNGLGEFWYHNQIDPTLPDLVHFTVTGSAPASTGSLSSDAKFGPSHETEPLTEKLLIPIGGGKDSAALVGWLTRNQLSFGALLLQPHSPAATAVAQLSAATETIKLRRTIDPQLKALNAQGFLNGHTPFSAYLGWASVFAARLFGYTQVAVANEQSANEGNVQYHGLTINHQYSKTTHYETAFRAYLGEFFAPRFPATPTYFSAWRPLNELQISLLFSQESQFFPVFRSCNVGQQKNLWCQKCAKCVFVYSILGPFLDPRVLQRQIFDHDLLADQELLPIWLELLGYQANKPFECVGTQQEILVALAETRRQYVERGQALPIVLVELQKRMGDKLAAAPELHELLDEFAGPHFLPKNLETALRQSLLIPEGAPTSPASQPIHSTQPAKTDWSQHPSVKRLIGKKIVIVGLGREGLATYRWLRSVMPQQPLTLADASKKAAKTTEWQTLLAQDEATEVITGPDYLAAVTGQDFLFMSPGIRTDLPAIKAALKAGAQLHSQTQLFFELCPAQIIGITGTKGKSTTSSLIYHVLHTNGVESVLVGNIGTPALNKLAEITPHTWVVAELSCHQLQHLTHSPHIAVIQNITSEHLDYYPTTAAYVAAKSAIARFQAAQDFAIFQPSFTTAAGVAALGQGQPLTYRIDAAEPTDTDVLWLKNNQLWWQKPNTDSPAQAVISVSEIPLRGHHNLYNVAPAIIIGSQLGLSPAQISAAVQSFHGLPHRLQKVASVAGVEYYDDSLSTTPEATIAALSGFGDKPIVLIAGGYERHQDFGALATAILEANVVGVVLLPTTGQRLGTDLQAAAKKRAGQTPLPQLKTAKTMAEAVAAAKQLVPSNGIVLMSPASASFNAFKDYHDRGVQFAEAAKL
jgi:UDP-N-acetylmuramoylalanine--D-glutamate ligase